MISKCLQNNRTDFLIRLAVAPFIPLIIIVIGFVLGTMEAWQQMSEWYRELWQDVVDYLDSEVEA
jgi:hypothetical protein